MQSTFEGPRSPRRLGRKRDWDDSDGWASSRDPHATRKFEVFKVGRFALTHRMNSWPTTIVSSPLAYVNPPKISSKANLCDGKGNPEETSSSDKRAICLSARGTRVPRGFEFIGSSTTSISWTLNIEISTFLNYSSSKALSQNPHSFLKA